MLSLLINTNCKNYSLWQQNREKITNNEENNMHRVTAI